MHFPRSHDLTRSLISDQLSYKMSYRSMPNLKNLIKQHNSKILSKEQYNGHATELKKVVL